MSSGSVRLHVPIDLHQHGDPPEGGEGLETFPDGRSEGDPAGTGPQAPGRLWREDGKVLYRPADGSPPEPARVVWARPLSRRGGPVSIMMARKKKELAYLPCLDPLDDESRRVAMEELAASAVLPVISVIHEVRPRFGNYYFDVETDMGRRKFLLSSPENNSYRPRPDAIVVKDVSGNFYEIASVSALSRSSRSEMERAL